MGNGPAKDTSKELLQAILNDDVSAVRKLLKGAPAENLNAIDKEEGTLLHRAAANGSSKVLKLLVELAGIRIDQQDNNGKTALHAACDNGNDYIVQILLERNANVNIQDKKGKAALHLASYKGHVDIVKVLLKAGAEVNMQMESGKTALQLAATKSYAKVVETLLGAHADVNLQEKDGKTALHAACDNGSDYIVQMLLEHNANVNIQDKDGWAALHHAAQNGLKDTMELLFQAKSMLSVNIRKNDGWTGLHIAAHEGHKDIVESLLRAGAGVNFAVEEGGWTALHIASQNGKKDVVQALLINGADIDLQSSLCNGWSALHLASYNGHIEVVEILLAAQANVALENKDGDTALSLAKKQAVDPIKKSNQESIVNLLSSASSMKKFKIEDQSLNQPTWIVDKNEIVLTDKELGRGGWAIVRVAKFRGLLVAAKCIHHHILSSRNIGLFKQEMNLAAIARHPNLVQFIGATVEGQPIILMELMPTSLRKLLQDKKEEPLSHRQIVSIARDVALGLNYLHIMKPDPIIHRDVSSANVLMEPLGTDSWKAKVSDYGTANFQEYMHTPGAGNVSYASPEAANPLQQSVKMDVFSYGILLLEMCTGEFPDPKIRPSSLKQLDASWPEMAGIVRGCLKMDPNQRPSMADLLEILERLHESGWTALHIASQNGKKDVVQALLINGADIDLQSSKPDRDGWSALHLASYYGHKAVVEILLAAQANVALKTKDGDTALSLAMKQAGDDDPIKNSNQESIVNLLSSASSMKKFKVEDQSLNQPSWIVDKNEIVLTDEILGEGGWAVVRVAKFRGLLVAAKCIHHHILSSYNIGLFKREMNLAAIARHPNLLQFIGATVEGQPIILMELMPTSLRKVLEEKKGGSLSHRQIVSIARDVALGLNYLHNMKPDPIIHRDVSSANVLMEPLGTDSWKAKVSDYGTANFQEYMHTPGAGNVSYASPEMANPLQQSVKMDVFSYGILLLEMCTGQFPDSKKQPSSLQQLDTSWPGMAGIVRGCLKMDPNQRPSMADLLEKLERLSSN